MRDLDLAEVRLQVTLADYTPVDTLLVLGDDLLPVMLVLQRQRGRPPGQVAGLVVTSTPPRATVFVNDQRRGLTPYRLDSVERGPLAVRVEAAGHVVWRQTGVLPGQTDTLHAELQRVIDVNGGMGTVNGATGTLVVTAQGGGTISVAGQRRTGRGSFTLSPGTHSVRCEHPQYSAFQTSVLIRSGRTRTETCYFEGTVSVSAGPVWGAIWIDDRNTGQQTPAQLTLGPGTHRIVVRRDGYRVVPASVSVTLSAGFSSPSAAAAFRLEQESTCDVAALTEQIAKLEETCLLSEPNSLARSTCNSNVDRLRRDLARCGQ